MIKQLYNKNKFLFKTSLFSSLLFLVIGILFIVDTIQKQDRNKLGSDFATLSEYKEYDTYDISGMTQEEINEMLKEIREGKLNGK